MSSLKHDSTRRLVVIPSDPIRVFEQAGYEGLAGYYNPKGLFDEVFVLSPFEDQDRRAHGMNIRSVSRRDFRKTLTRLEPNVVRAYGGHWPAEVACENRIPGVPVLASVHDTAAAALYPVVRYADLVLCVSEAVEEAARKVGTDQSRIRRLPNRVDRSVFRPVHDAQRLARVSSRFPPGKYILHVGRKTPQKNIETLIESLLHLPDDYSAIFVGLGDVGPYLALADSRGLGRRCYWIESVKNSELPLWYSWCDCMCTPSRWEGFGIVFIEAAACGSPIVTSDIAPMNEYLTHDQSAHLVKDYENPAALAQAVRDVCENDEYRRRLSAGAIEAAEPFDRRTVDDREEAIYREALKLKPRVLSFGERIGMASFVAGRQAARARNLPAKLNAIVEKLTPVPRWGNSFKAPEENRVAAKEWIRRNELPSGGIRVHSRHQRAYPEVTGYIIPTLLDCNEDQLAVRLARWLIEIQLGDGSYPDPDRGNPHVFDTAQALRGLLAVENLLEEAAAAAERAADYLVRRMIDDGRSGIDSQYQDTIIPETIQLYSLPPLFEAARRTGKTQWKAAAERCLNHYLKHPHFLDLGRLTHFLAYELEALIDLDCPHQARPILDRLAATQASDGSVPATNGSAWVCTPGLAQLAVCWYKLGQNEPADRAMHWLERHQRPSGGFLGSVGPGADYFPRAELSWAAKYFLDADRLRTQTATPS